MVFDTTISWNSDTFLDIAFLLLAGALLVRFLRTGGVDMLRMMERPQGHGGHVGPDQPELVAAAHRD